MCIIFCVLPWFSLLFACVFIFHFSFSFSISIFIQFILMPFKAAHALVEWLQNEVGGCGCSWGGITPFGIPGLQTLFSRELTWYMANDVDSARGGKWTERREKEKGSQPTQWIAVGVVINTCLYMSLLQHAHWAPSHWKNKYSIEIKAHWMPHAIVSRWLNYRCAGEIFFLMKIKKHKELFTVIAFEVSQVDLVFN